MPRKLTFQKDLVCSYLTSWKDVGVLNGHTHWLFKCKCGTKKILKAGEVIRGRIRSCGCLATEKRSAIFLNPKTRPKRKYPKVTAHQIYKRYRHGAKRRKLSFTLSLPEFTKLIKRDCHYCGCKPSQKLTKKVNGKLVTVLNHNGIDRLSSSLGYVFNNCVPCCKNCNLAKMSLSVDQFLELIESIYNNHFGERHCQNCKCEVRRMRI